MCWLLLTVLYLCLITASIPVNPQWVCPKINKELIVECSCDVPHTLRCTGRENALDVIGEKLRFLNPPASISLLDCTIKNLVNVSTPILEGLSLKGLVVTSGEITTIHEYAFQKLGLLTVLGLPNNKLVSVPVDAFKYLPNLTKLDLSNNKLKKIKSGSFQDNRNLSFIDLSSNEISWIASNAFSGLIHLRILWIQNNYLKIPALHQLKYLYSIEELNLSSNQLDGPLDIKTFPNISNLRNLQLSFNSFTSIKMGAMEGLPYLQFLSLDNNQIDVLEDHAFLYISQLRQLNLSHNRIVALSEGSLDHLENLIDLDLSNNFLREIGNDLLAPLQKLKNLLLNDNEISVILGDSFKSRNLKKLNLHSNPLNCDCKMYDFASWLLTSNLSKIDKESAICAIPPNLENGALIEISPNQLLCDDNSKNSILALDTAPVKTNIHLRNFTFDGVNLILEWYIEEKLVPYTCNAIIAYEEDGYNEILLESHPLKCNSSFQNDPKLLHVSVPNSFDLKLGNRYRFCIVLFASAEISDALSLAVGCSDVFTLIPNIENNHQKFLEFFRLIKSSLNFDGSLLVDINIEDKTNCEINLFLFQLNGSLNQKKVKNCSVNTFYFKNLKDNIYILCINVVKWNNFKKSGQKTQCVQVKKERHIEYIDQGMIMLIVLVIGALIMSTCILRRYFQKYKYNRTTINKYSSFNKRYSQLQATTTL